MGKFDEVKNAGTDGTNYGIDNQAILAKLESWDERYGVEVRDVEFNRLVITFRTLPDDLAALAEEIYEFCPDTVEQGYGCMDDMMEGMEEFGHELAPELVELVEGVDFEDENFGLVLLAKDLKRKKEIVLWWD